MAGKPRIDNNRIIELNSAGLSLIDVAKRVGIHHTNVSHRLKGMGVTPFDTRHAFMDSIFQSLSQPQQEWLIRQLAPDYSIKDFVRSLLLKEFIHRTSNRDPILTSD